MTYHCVGCGKDIGWNGTGVFSYTCGCGSIIFADNSNVSVPASLLIKLKTAGELPHIDYYLGHSNYVSAEKQKVYDELRKVGAIWSWECKKCKARYIERKKMQREYGLLTYDLHPELKTMLNSVVKEK